MNEQDFNKERRKQKRVRGLFPARVRCQKGYGQVIEIHALVENISDGGLYLQMPKGLIPCERLFTLTQLPGGAGLAAVGNIIRREPRMHGLQGLAVRFTRRRLIPARNTSEA